MNFHTIDAGIEPVLATFSKSSARLSRVTDDVCEYAKEKVDQRVYLTLDLQKKNMSMHTKTYLK